MSYHVAFSISVSHDYWGDDTPPLQIVPSDATEFAKQGLIAKQGEASLDIVAETQRLTEPVTLTLNVIAQDADLVLLTEGPDWATLPHVDLTSTQDDADILLMDVLKDTDASRYPDDPLLQLDVRIAPDVQRKQRLRMPAVSALWAYHITGNKVDEPLQVIDRTKQHDFEDLGTTPLPEGRVARVIRSKTPIALQRRSSLRLALEEPQDAPFDPVTLIPVLPVAGVNLRPAPDKAAGATLQSDIFVSLW